MAELIDRTGKAPTRKVASGFALGVPISIVVIWLINELWHITFPPNVEIALQAIIQGLIVFGVQWRTRDRAP